MLTMVKALCSQNKRKLQHFINESDRGTDHTSQKLYFILK